MATAKPNVVVVSLLEEIMQNFQWNQHICRSQITYVMTDADVWKGAAADPEICAIFMADAIPEVVLAES